MNTFTLLGVIVICAFSMIRMTKQLDCIPKIWKEALEKEGMLETGGIEPICYNVKHGIIVEGFLEIMRDQRKLIDELLTSNPGSNKFEEEVYKINSKIDSSTIDANGLDKIAIMRNEDIIDMLRRLKTDEKKGCDEDEAEPLGSDQIRKIAKVEEFLEIIRDQTKVLVELLKSNQGNDKFEKEVSEINEKISMLMPENMPDANQYSMIVIPSD